MATRLKILVIAVATGKIGYVFLIGGELRDWSLSRKASKSPKNATKQTEKWIGKLEPDVVVTEKIEKHSRKGDKTKSLIAAVARVAGNAKISDVSVPRVQLFNNKYHEANYLVGRFPAIQAWLPNKRKLWESEPRNIIYFEALALSLQIIDGPDTHTHIN